VHDSGCWQLAQIAKTTNRKIAAGDWLQINLLNAEQHLCDSAFLAFKNDIIDKNSW
jgi:hypothetical protein